MASDRFDPFRYWSEIPYTAIDLVGRLENGRLRSESLTLDAQSLGMVVSGEVGVVRPYDAEAVVGLFFLRTLDSLINRVPVLNRVILGQDDNLVGAYFAITGDWPELEALYERFDLPPALPAAACREPLPVYDGGRQVGQVTSHTWSPILKKMIALASVRTPWAGEGNRLEVEHTVEYERHTVAARVRPTPFFDPPRKRAIVKRRGRDAG